MFSSFILHIILIIVYIIIIIGIVIYGLCETPDRENVNSVKNYTCLNACSRLKEEQPSSSSNLLQREDAGWEEAPYAASLQRKIDGKLTHVCGAVILNANVVLTAAHCLHGDLYIVAGTIDLNSDEKQVREVDKIVPHEWYFDSGPYDIGVARLKDPLILTNRVQPIELAEEISLEKKSYLYGFGNLSKTEDPVYPNKLKKSEMPIMDNHYSAKISGFPVHATNLTTGPVDGTNSLCDGDSGSPLIQYDKESDKGFLVGLGSCGSTPCGQINAPSIFESTVEHKNWINKMMHDINK